MKVYIPNKGGLDYSDAVRFGEVIFCSEGLLDAFDTSAMYRTFAAHFNDSHQDDYIVITSLNILCSVACAVFASKHKRLNLLLFKNGAYLERHLVMNNLLTHGEQDAKGEDALTNTSNG